MNQRGVNTHESQDGKDHLRRVHLLVSHMSYQQHMDEQQNGKARQRCVSCGNIPKPWDKDCIQYVV